tara:strand:+ start:3590 stop:3793 length:204 start_codon:yes stop_codon:yes gene_type:complete
MILFLKIIFSFFPPNIKFGYYSPYLTLNQFILESFYIKISFLMDFTRKIIFIFFFIEGYFFSIKNVA